MWTRWRNQDICRLMSVSLIESGFDHGSLGTILIILLMRLWHLLDHLVRSFLSFFCLLCLAVECVAGFYLSAGVHLLFLFFGHVLTNKIISLHPQILISEILNNFVDISQSYPWVFYAKDFADEPSKIIVAVHQNLCGLLQKQLHLFFQFRIWVNYNNIHFLLVFL